MDKKNENKLNASAIILAGGQSSRMHRNKAFLRLDGIPLVERTLDLLNDIFAEVLISSNEPELYRTYDVPVVRDQVTGHGPIAGLQAGLTAARYEACFFAACDMPFLDPALIRHLAQWREDFDVLVPQDRSGLHPLHAFYKKTC